jgi:uncharacterized protein YgfB (UPF0149 family)
LASVKGAVFVTEQFAFQKIVGQRAAVHRDEGVVAARTEIMQRSCGEFLAGAGLALDQHRRVHAGDAADDAQRLPE